MPRTWVAVLLGVSMPLGGALAQAPGAPNCAMFTTMSEEHGKKAQAIEQDAAERARTLTGEAAANSADIAARAAKSEWEMAALSREAARKCLQDFIAGGQSTAAAPVTSAPIQQTAPSVAPVRQAAPVIVRQAPVVVQEQAAPVVIQQVPVQQFHATAVSAMAMGAAALSNFGNRGDDVRRAPETFSGQGMNNSGNDRQRFPGNAAGQGIQQFGGGGATGNNPSATGKPKAMRESVFEGPTTVSHNRQTSAKTRTTNMSDGSQTRTTTQRLGSGANLIHKSHTKADGSFHSEDARVLSRRTIVTNTVGNPDGTVTQTRQLINRETGQVRNISSTPTSLNTPPTTRANWNRMIGKKNN